MEEIIYKEYDKFPGYRFSNYGDVVNIKQIKY